MRLRLFLIIIGFLFISLLATADPVKAHCEIPCGIYDDSMRYDMLVEHIATIEKSMNQIIELSTAADKNYNQLIRWVVNKEEHARQFMDIVTQYFLTQRIKPVAPDAGQAYKDYISHLAYFHEMLVYAMKCKQTVEKVNVDKLKELVALSRKLYFKEP